MRIFPMVTRGNHGHLLRRQLCILSTCALLVGLLLSGNVTETQPQIWHQVVTTGKIDEEAALSCLEHESFEVHDHLAHPNEPDATEILSAASAAKCGILRRRWLNNPPISRIAKILDRHQQNCDLPVASHYFDNKFGLGSHLVLWGQALCNAMQLDVTLTSSQTAISSPVRMLSQVPQNQPWLWLDQMHCREYLSSQEESPLSCYFPMAENRCATDKDLSDPLFSNYLEQRVADPRKIDLHCPLVNNTELLVEFRSAATEYLFRNVSPLVIREAKRQVGVIFEAVGGIAPADLITVHMRWGDKGIEMVLPSIEEYIEAIQTLSNNASNANIYLATEDPEALKAFLNAKPSGWKVFPDITLSEINTFRPVNGNGASLATLMTEGRAGLVAMGSLLVAMEGNKFVLTTKSNWSTLMNHLRTNVIDPRCGNCTSLIDLRPAVWRAPTIWY